VGKCRGGNWEQSYCSTVGFLPPFFSVRKKKNQVLQASREEDPRVLFAKMRRCPSGFRSSKGLTIFQRGIKEEFCSEGKKTQARRIGSQKNQSSEKL